MGIKGEDLTGEDCEQRRVTRTVSCSGACTLCGRRFEDGDEAIVVSTVTKQRGRFIRDTVHRIVHSSCQDKEGNLYEKTTERTIN